MSHTLLPFLKGILLLPRTNFPFLNNWYVAFIVKYKKLFQGVPIQNHLNQQPLPNHHNYWNIIRVIQNTHSHMIFTKLIIKNCLLRVTCNYTTTCNEHLNIVDKVTFRISPRKPTFWWDARVPSSISIITLFFLLFAISIFICAFTHRFRGSSFESAFTCGIIRAIIVLSIELVFKSPIHLIVDFLINFKSFKM